VGAPPPSGESTRETPIRWLDGGGGNDEKQFGLGQTARGKPLFIGASIYS
jgi:hypothetical protein